MIHGSCQCKSIRYQISEPPINCCYCYCSICRKLTGSSFGTYGTIAKSKLTWLAGKKLLRSYQQNKSLTRNFCSVFGSFIASLHDLDPLNVFLSLGCLESNDIIDIEYQQFIDSKADWVQPNSNIEQHATWPEWVLQKIERDE